MEKWQVKANGGLRARKEPVSGKIAYVIPNNKVVNIYHKKVVKNQTWGQLGSTKDKNNKTVPGLWICLKYARRYYDKPKSPVPGYRVTTPYGRKKRGLWKSKGYHTGDDYAAPSGKQVIAVTGGTIARAWDSYLGNVILLFSDNGDTYWYCHLSKFTRGSGRVRRGEVIGRVGSTGKGALGPHLHFERHDKHTRSWWARDMKPTW